MIADNISFNIKITCSNIHKNALFLHLNTFLVYLCMFLLLFQLPINKCACNIYLYFIFE